MLLFTRYLNVYAMHHIVNRWIIKLVNKNLVTTQFVDRNSLNFRL